MNIKLNNLKITIIGLGLIGGSLAKALHERLGISKIIGIDDNIDFLETALIDGLISHGFTSLKEQVWSSDIIFICTPTKNTIDYISLISKKASPDCIISDVSSTKETIINFVNSLPSPPCFIGGHPMAGTEKTGYHSSISHLFENAYYILTPSVGSTKIALDLMSDVVQAIGGIPIILNAFEHDRITGGISHVPHIIASALVNMVKQLDAEDGRMQTLAAGGFKDITRIASSNPALWENIISSNRGQILSIIDLYIDILNNFINDLNTNNSEKILAFFDSAKKFRSLLPSRKHGLINPLFDITIDVVDRPGIIGEIASLLGSNNINIKNINVSNSREFEQGCLRITLQDLKSVDDAFNILNGKGYKAYKNL